jgi:hypothetical protein
MKPFSALLLLFLLATLLPAQEDNRRTITRNVTLDSSVFAVTDQVLVIAMNAGHNLLMTRENRSLDVTLLAPVEEVVIRFLAGERAGEAHELYVENTDSIDIKWDAEQAALTTNARPAERYAALARFRERTGTETDGGRVAERLTAAILADSLSAFSVELLRDYLDRFGADTNGYRHIVSVLDADERYHTPKIAGLLSRMRNAIEPLRIDLTAYDLEAFDTGDRKEPAPDRPTLIKVWFVNCAPCVADDRRIAADRKQDQFPAVRLIGLSIDREASVWRNYLQEKEAAGRHYRFNELRDFSDLIARVGVGGTMPLYLLLDPAGYLVETFNRYTDVKAYLAQDR